jgi:hypothetical protein
MAWSLFKKDDAIVQGDGPVTEREVRKIISQTPAPEFYELEAAEVIECYLDDEDLPYVPETGERDYSKYGFVKCRMILSSNGVHDTVEAGPMDSDIRSYPYPGEYVIICKYIDQFFWSQKLNLRNRSDSNILPGLSNVQHAFAKEDYKTNLPPIENTQIRALNAEEGDITLEGRFGNSIRLGSNVKQIKTKDGVDESTGKFFSPSVIIRAGQGQTETARFKPVKENINLDGSSLWMTTNQTVPLEQHKSKIQDVDPKTFDGKQILINTDRIVFNSRKDAYLYSSNDINLISKNRIVLEGHERVYLGNAPKEGESVGWAGPSDNPSIQPALKGDQTMIIIEALIGYIKEFAVGIMPAKGTCVNFVIPISDINTSAAGLISSLNSLKTRLDEPKSDVVFVGDKR